MTRRDSRTIRLRQIAPVIFAITMTQIGDLTTGRLLRINYG